MRRYLNTLWGRRLVDITRRKDVEQSEGNPRKKPKNELTVRTKLGSVGVDVRLYKRGGDSIQKNSFTYSRPLPMLVVSGGVMLITEQPYGVLKMRD
eukprot:7319269-Pyramimonas_sp.AAC.1